MEWNGILPVRDVSQADFFIWKIHFVNADGFAVHFHYHADRDVILSEKVFDGFLSAVCTGPVSYTHLGMRRLVKRLLKKHKYPPEGMDDAVQTVMSQCEMWTDNVF